MRRAFTLVEILLAVMLLGVLTVVTSSVFYTVTHGWQTATDYIDKLQRTDYALEQLTSSLRSAYYPALGEQTYEYGFMLQDNGNGESVHDSDTIEWSKLGTAIVGTKSSVGDSVHRIQLRVLEAGDTDWQVPIERTGLYARVKPNVKPIALKTGASESLDFDNNELYHPILVADGVVGFNCRVMPEKPTELGTRGELDANKFEDEFANSNAVPYMVQLTLYIEKEDENFISQTKRLPIVRVVKLPVHEQSKDGRETPSENGGKDAEKGGKKKGGATK